jgi:hypothetical protein
MEIILEWSVGDNEEWKPNGMDEGADYDLRNVQSKYSVTKSLVIIHRHLGNITGAGRLTPPGKDEWTGDNEVDEPMCPPPSIGEGA